MARKITTNSTSTQKQTGVEASITASSALQNAKPTFPKKETRKKLSGLRQAIRAIFKPKMMSKNLSAELKHPSPERLENEDVKDETMATGCAASPVDRSRFSSCSQSSSQSSSSIPSSTKSVDINLLPAALETSIPSPPGDSASYLDARKSPLTTESPSFPKESGRAKKSDFYVYNGQPSYLGSRLYQYGDLEPEMDVLGEWVELGRGETGTTRLVHLLPESAKLATAKIIQGDNPEARLRRELDAFHIVRGHASFPQLIGVLQQAPLRCILQEFVGNDFIPENLTLEDVLRGRKVSASEIPHSDWQQIAKDIAEGLWYLHEQEYIHINLKPENILLYATDGSRRGWRAKICDLGDCTFKKLAPKIHSTPDIRAAAEASPKPFVAPEVLCGETPFTTASDVYAFGRVLRSIGKKTKITSLQQTGKKCSRRTASKRPDMEKVVRMLNRVSSFS